MPKQEYFLIEVVDGARLDEKFFSMSSLVLFWYKHQQVCQDCRGKNIKVIRVTISEEVYEKL